MIPRNQIQKKLQIKQSNRRLRLLVSRFNSTMHNEVILELQNRGMKIAYWERARGEHSASFPDKKKFPGTIFHSGLDAIRGLSAQGVDIKSFKPLGRKFIHEMLECESQVLTMMTIEDLEGNIPVIKKKHLYYRYLKYWYGILATLNIDAVIFGDIPHTSFQFVMYYLAKHLGIKTVMMRWVKVGGRYIILDDIQNYKNIQKIVERNKGKNFKLEELSSGIQAYYKKHTQKTNDPTPFFIKKGFARKDDFVRVHFPRPRSIVKNLREGIFWKTTYWYILTFYATFFSKKQIGNLEEFNHTGFYLQRKARQWRKIRQTIKREYERVQNFPDLSKPFIFVPLHNQPEASTSAMGGVFVDQLFMIDILDAALPKGWQIYVKENPIQWSAPRTHMGRFSGYYEKIAKKKSATLVPVEVSTYELIEKSKAVASVTGTALQEALIRGKPALVFGYIWIMHCSEIFRVHDLASCLSSLKKIQAGFVPNKQNILNYLGALDEVSFSGYHNKRTILGHQLGITEKENIDNITNAFYGELQK